MGTRTDSLKRLKSCPWHQHVPLAFSKRRGGGGYFILIAGLGNRGQSGTVVRTLTLGGE